jgi:large subunit ribosomal protein L22
MEVKAVQKFIRMSPKKIRVVADVARGMKPRDAIERLPFLGKKAGEPIIGVLKAALANAKVKGLDEQSLVIKELMVGEGPRLKRGRPVSRGRWHPYKRRMSHIRVVLESREPQAIKEAKDMLEADKKLENKSMDRDFKAKKSVKDVISSARIKVLGKGGNKEK